MKGLKILLVVLLIAVGVAYLLPQKQPTTTVSFEAVHQSIAYRCFAQPALRNKWLTPPAQNFFTSIQPRMFYEIQVSVLHHNQPINGVVRFLGLGADSTAVEWELKTATANTPWGRVQQWLNNRSLKKDMNEVLASFHKFLQKQENVYGTTISNQRVTDTLLVSTKASFTSYPQPQDYYPLIDKLKAYATTKGAQVTNYPMLHIYSEDEKSYIVRVAIPVNKILEGTGSIFFNRMVPGNILVTEVEGGNKKIEEGMAQMDQFISDHRLKPPAIPYQSMITDRLAQPDSAHWRTKLYFPIF